MIEAKNLTRQFPGGTVALEGINLTVPDGQFISLVGPSGCGKSTLLSLLAGLDKPSAGSVIGIERPAVVFQDAALYPWKTVLQNVAFGLELRGLSKAACREKAEVALRTVHLSRFARAYPHELSGGMRQRAAIARALVLEPDALFLDEPFGALDAQTRSLLQTELLTLWERTQVSVVFVTHSLEEAIALSDRVILMASRPGRIIADVLIDAPRPRALRHDLTLAAIQDRLLAQLSEEVARVAAQEYDTDWRGVPLPTLSVAPGEEGGSGI
ncbi:ABC transporter ATP-binding protein [Armatimonas sp.]|uniref:ABC transporter ATP-binding protein n=1 Tax=Armatimonas sp. TaxID=1872638 RepID=UPI003752B135